MKRMPSLGEQEMALLKHISEKSPITVREVAQFFESQLARTTVLTMMERLRKKGFLVRSRLDGVFHYTAKFETGDVLKSKISDFVEKTLGGSVGPLVNYFISSSNLSDKEVTQLKELAERIEKKGGAK